MFLYRDESTLLSRKSTLSLTFGLIGVLTELVDSKPSFFTRFLAYLDWDRNIPESCWRTYNPRKWVSFLIMLISNSAYMSFEKLWASSSYVDPKMISSTYTWATVNSPSSLLMKSVWSAFPLVKPCETRYCLRRSYQPWVPALIHRVPSWGTTHDPESVDQWIL